MIGLDNRADEYTVSAYTILNYIYIASFNHTDLLQLNQFKH